MLAIVFGLSMDYEVFLLSRIRERWSATGDPRGSVAEGLQASARTITSAALIMASVFLVFVGTGVPSIQQLGVGCAVAILLDATLVRLVLVPAAMELLGEVELVAAPAAGTRAAGRGGGAGAGGGVGGGGRRCRAGPGARAGAERSAVMRPI